MMSVAKSTGSRIWFPTPLTLVLLLFDLMVFVPEALAAVVAAKIIDHHSQQQQPQPQHQELGQPKSLVMNCSQQSNQFCSNDLNLRCDPITGQCRCREEYPVRLAADIPCLKNRSLGELCIHTAECGQTEHAVCVATFLFTMKTLSKTPSYKQWFFYNKIHNDDDMNYLLSKMYGRCRCQKGFRAAGPTQCVPAGVDTPYRCDHQRDCGGINARCDGGNRCQCWPGYHYDVHQRSCDQISNLYGKFCAASADCFRPQSNMECKNSQCLCPRGYLFYNGTVNGCQRKDSWCPDGNVWNETSRSCLPYAHNGHVPVSSSSSPSSSPSSSSLAGVAFCATAIKCFPFLLIVVIIFNLICYIRGKHSHDMQRQEIRDLSISSRHRYDLSHYHYHLQHRQQQEHHRSSNILQQGGSYSLLSLPDYETIFNNNNNNNSNSNYNGGNSAAVCFQKQQQLQYHHHYQQEDEDDDEEVDHDHHLPTYEEALEALRRLQTLRHNGADRIEPTTADEEQTDHLIPKSNH